MFDMYFLLYPNYKVTKAMASHKDLELALVVVVMLTLEFILAITTLLKTEIPTLLAASANELS